MRVLMVAPAFYPRIGGGERYNTELARALAHAGIDIRVITTTLGGEVEGLDVIRAGSAVHDWAGIIPTFTVMQHIKMFKPDAIQTCGPNPNEILHLPLFAAAKLKRASVYISHLNLAKPVSRLYTAMHVRALRSYNRVVCLNNSLRVDLISRGLDSRKLSVITPGISDVFFSSQPRIRTPTILFVGAMDNAHAYKRLDILLEAMAIFAAGDSIRRLVIVGNGAMTGRYRKQVHDLKIETRVDFLQDVSDVQLRELYATSEALCLPSPSIQEGFGLVVGEAMAAGCPVVCTSAAGCSDIVKEGGGFIVPPFDSTAIAKTLRQITSNPHLSAATAKRGQKFIRRFRWSAVGAYWRDHVLKPMLTETP